MNKYFDEKTKNAIWDVVIGYKEKRKRALEELGFVEQEYKDQIARKRGKVFDNFEENIEKAKTALEENGFILHQAENAGSAKEVLKSILKDGDVIAKAKTNTGREIGIEEVLKDLEFFETDLGDAIIQLFDEQEQHYVLPAIHVSAEKISEKIEQVYGDKVEADPKRLTHYLCGKIKKKILQANVGLTGANFFTKTGQIVLLENEGNISLVSRLPQKHIVLVGIDKLAESVEDAVKFCQTAAIFGTGQKNTQYVSVISGPSKTADIENKLVQGAQGPQEVHVILIDNGRRRLLENGFGELLRCINCGACINFCPVYHQLGNNYGGDKYIGSKGIITTAFMENFSSARDRGSFKCTLCGNCAENCPMKISLNDMVRKVRVLQNNDKLQTEANKKMLNRIEKFGNPFGGKSKSVEKSDELYCC